MLTFTLSVGTGETTLNDQTFQDFLGPMWGVLKGKYCQEIGLVAFMFFFELLFSYVSSSISFYVSLTNLFSIILFPYLLITRDTQDKGEARFRFY